MGGEEDRHSSLLRQFSTPVFLLPHFALLKLAMI